MSAPTRPGDGSPYAEAVARSQAAIAESREFATRLSDHQQWRVPPRAGSLRDSLTERLDISCFISPERNPMNVTTTIVRTKAGWLGQIVVSNEIVWESTPKKTGEKAKRAADKRVAAKTAELFGA